MQNSKRFALRVVGSALVMLASSSWADTHPALTLGPIQMLAHHLHYASITRETVKSRWETYSTPQVDCAGRAGNDILAVARERLINIDGASGLLRGSFVHGFRGTCAVAGMRRGSDDVIVVIGHLWSEELQDNRLTLGVLTPRGATLALYASHPADHEEPIDIAIVGSQVFFNEWDRARGEGAVRTFDIATLTKGPSFDIADYEGLFADGRAVYALAEHNQAWLLDTHNSPVRAARPRGATTGGGCNRGTDEHLPVWVPSRNLFALLAYPKPKQDHSSPESVVLRDANGALVAERVLGAAGYCDDSFIIPWDDGLRIIAQLSPMEGFQVWKVPFGP